ncbi:hypothetical protein GQ44DRAFT_733699 [Phaeosphaeriaceae sp. PMI808]|nr:hypothetical protein GQ44DRAFT_733699 [Phaeosphaeriaceae sp. PMI808]
MGKRNILAGWAATGLFPFTPERVLRHTPKPSAELTVPEPDEVMSCPQDRSLQMPITSVTPVTTEALMSLHNLITQALNDPSKRRLQRHVQKLASAAKISFAKQTLRHARRSRTCYAAKGIQYAQSKSANGASSSTTKKAQG